ncbi:MAG TPA: hypothetical protein VHQ95_23740 [Pyrinomonadaceae bacterium]|nr:hypothetical protein [Pyrinomonadaceae bacterium]
MSRSSPKYNSGNIHRHCRSIPNEREYSGKLEGLVSFIDLIDVI